MKAFLIGLGVLILIAAILIVSNINNVPKLDENVKAAWSQVQNQYKRRADLIPNLVSTVKGYASHEKETLNEIVQARSQVGKLNVSPEILSNPQAFKQFEKAQSALSSALSRLMVVVERYPNLKANENFLALQSQLEGTENRITVARRDYIQAVKFYNLELRTFPGKIVAAIVYPEAKIKETFTANPQEQETPKVKF